MRAKRQLTHGILWITPLVIVMTSSLWGNFSYIAIFLCFVPMVTSIMMALDHHYSKQITNLHPDYIVTLDFLDWKTLHLRPPGNSIHSICGRVITDNNISTSIEKWDTIAHPELKWCSECDELYDEEK